MAIGMAIEQAVRGIGAARTALESVMVNIRGRYGWFTLNGGAPVLGSFALGYPGVKEIICCDLNERNLDSPETLRAALYAELGTLDG